MDMTSLLRRALALTFESARNLSPAFLLAVLCGAAIALFSDNYYLIELLTAAALFALFAASWDVFCGSTTLDNFGHAAFVGIAGYAAAILNTSFGLPVWLTVPISASVAALLGLGIGWLTLRLRGPYFALATLAFGATLYKLTFVLSAVTRGEDGISGIAPLSSDAGSDLLFCLAALTVSVALLGRFSHSHYGLILRSTRDNGESAEASGINGAYYKIIGFVISAFFGGMGGALYAHIHMQASPELLAGSLSVLIVLYCVIGGRGTLLGPVFCAALLTLLNEYLRLIEVYRFVLFGLLIVTLIYLNPNGLANAHVLRRHPALRRFILG